MMQGPLFASTQATTAVVGVQGWAVGVRPGAKGIFGSVFFGLQSWKSLGEQELAHPAQGGRTAQERRGEKGLGRAAGELPAKALGEGPGWHLCRIHPDPALGTAGRCPRALLPAAMGTVPRFPSHPCPSAQGFWVGEGAELEGKSLHGT